MDELGRGLSGNVVITYSKFNFYLEFTSKISLLNKMFLSFSPPQSPRVLVLSHHCDPVVRQRHVLSGSDLLAGRQWPRASASPPPRAPGFPRQNGAWWVVVLPPSVRLAIPGHDSAAQDGADEHEQWLVGHARCHSGQLAGHGQCGEYARSYSYGQLRDRSHRLLIPHALSVQYGALARRGSPELPGGHVQGNDPGPVDGCRLWPLLEQ